MTELVWMNGTILPLPEARVSVEDRGFQFADGVYEVIRVYGGKPFALVGHLERLERSAAGIELKVPISRGRLAAEMMRLIGRTDFRDSMVYLQLTRGIAERGHAFPSQAKPTLLFYVREIGPAPRIRGEAGVKLVSVADDRWQRCWVKSIALLPNVLAKQKAVAAGADEAVFVDQGIVNECSASNLFCIVGDRLMTHPVGAKVLPGITRAILLELASSVGLRAEERGLREEEAMDAEEIFITSTIREVAWVGEWNGRKSGHGEKTIRLHQRLKDAIARDVGE